MFSVGRRLHARGLLGVALLVGLLTPSASAAAAPREADPAALGGQAQQTLGDSLSGALGAVVMSLPYIGESTIKGSLPPSNPLRVGYYVGELQKPNGERDAVPGAPPGNVIFSLDYEVKPANAARSGDQLSQAWAALKDPCGTKEVTGGPGGAMSCMATTSARGTLDPNSSGDPYTGDGRVYVVGACADLSVHVGLAIFAAASHGPRNKPEVLSALKKAAGDHVTKATNTLLGAITSACAAQQAPVPPALPTAVPPPPALTQCPVSVSPDDMVAQVVTVPDVPTEPVPSGGAMLHLAGVPDADEGSSELRMATLQDTTLAAREEQSLSVQVTDTNPGSRPCCALSQFFVDPLFMFLGGSGFPLSFGSLDPSNLGGHTYRWKEVGSSGSVWGGPVGFVYTGKAGLVDLGHVRDNADMFRFIFQALLDGKTDLGLYEGNAAVVKLPQDTNSQLDLAGAITYAEGWAHELSTYGTTEQDFSAFSPEDLPSNIIGIELAKRAIRRVYACGPLTDDAYNKAIDVELNTLMTELDARDKATTDQFRNQIWNAWFTYSGGPAAVEFDVPLPDGGSATVKVASTPTLLRRNFDGKPWMGFQRPPTWIDPAVFKLDTRSDFTYRMKDLGPTLAEMRSSTQNIREQWVGENPGGDYSQRLGYPWDVYPGEGQ